MVVALRCYRTGGLFECLDLACHWYCSSPFRISGVVTTDAIAPFLHVITAQGLLPLNLDEEGMSGTMTIRGEKRVWDALCDGTGPGREVSGGDVRWN